MELHTESISLGMKFKNKLDNIYLDYVLRKTYNFNLIRI